MQRSGKRSGHHPYTSRAFREDRRAWLLVLMGCVCLGPILYGWSKPTPVPVRWTESAPTEHPRILVLYYDRVTSQENSGDLSAKQLEEQLRALKHRGFSAISLTDLAAFYRVRRPLPEKSVVLTFGHGYLETYEAVDPVLRKLRWPGSTSVITEAVTQRETFYLYWDRLSRMVQSGLWELASSGHNTRQAIVMTPEGQPGRYLYDPRWLDRLGRVETSDELFSRVDQDLATSLNLLERHLGPYRVRAFSPLYKHPSQHLADSPFRRALERHFQLGFIDGFVGVNDEYADPLSLRRFRVPSHWELDTFVDHVQQAFRSPMVVGAVPKGAVPAWFRPNGEPIMWPRRGPSQAGRMSDTLPVSGAVHWEHLKDGREGELWMPGGQEGENWALDLRFRLEHGEIGVRQVEFGNGEGWRWGGRPDGMFLHHRTRRGQYESLTHSPKGIELGSTHTLRVIKRGKGVLVSIDEENIWPLPVEIAGPRTGDLGLFGWATEGGASLWIGEANLSLLPYAFRWLPAFPEASDVQLVQKAMGETAGLSTTTHVVTAEGLTAVPYNETLYRMLVHRYAWDFIPTISVRAWTTDQPSSGFERLVSRLHDWIAENRWDRVHVSLDAQLSQYRDQLASALKVQAGSFHDAQVRWIVTSGHRPDASRSLFVPIDGERRASGLDPHATATSAL